MKDQILSVQRVILMRKINILQRKRLILHDNKWSAVSFYSCLIHHYSCDVLQLNLSHVAEHESFFLFGVRIKTNIDAVKIQVWLQKPFFLYLIHFSISVDSVSFISFYCSIVFLLIGQWLVNVGLSSHPSI